MVFEFSVVNFIHYVVDIKYPRFERTYDPYMLLLYTTMQCGCLEMFSVVSEFSFVRSL